MKLKLALKNLQERLKKMSSTPASSNDVHQMCIEHARAFMESTLESFQSVFDRLLTDGVEEAFKYVSFNSSI